MAKKLNVGDKIPNFNVGSPGCGIGIHGFLTFRQATRY